MTHSRFAHSINVGCIGGRERGGGRQLTSAAFEQAKKVQRDAGKGSCMWDLVK